MNDQEFLEPMPAVGGQHTGVHRLLAHRQHGGAHPERPRDLALSGGERASLGDEVGPVDAGGEIAIGKLKPARGAKRASRSWT